MKLGTIILVCLINAAVVVGCTLQGGEVRIRSGFTKFTTESLPLNVSSAVSKSWVTATPPPESPFPLLQLWCYPDFIVCAWFYQDTIAGVQIGYPIAQISNAVFNFITQGFFKWSVSGTQFWVTSQYFLSPEVLSGATTLSPSMYADQSVAPNVILKQGSVWVQGINSELTQIPTTKSAIKSNTLYKEQGCQIGKGRHFLFNSTRNSPECTADKPLHWFPITHDESMTATGLFLLANVARVPGQRDWFERPPGLGLRVLIPRAPNCLYKLADFPGVVSTHIYYVTEPNAILCPLLLL